MVSILCVQKGSNYYSIPGLDLWDIERDAYQYQGNNPVIAHPPCAQWSKMRAFSKPDQRQKDLAFFCYEKVKQNGGILEHPVGSLFFKSVDLSKGKLYKVFQSDFGFQSQKATLLWFVNCRPLPYPIFTQEARILKDVSRISANQRAKMPLGFCYWLVNSLQNETL